MKNWNQLAENFTATRQAYLDNPKEVVSENVFVANSLLVEKHYEAEEELREALKKCTHSELVALCAAILNK